MCGIVGYIGNGNVVPILINGLKKLEYRGYDSAGIAVQDKDGLYIRKCKGRLSILEEKIKGEDNKGTVGIGHTRWATHGEPSDINSHPHTNLSGDIAVVHNGIIENYMRLKGWLEDRGYRFISETDTEVVAHLINYYYKGDLLQAVRDTLTKLDGSYALAVICKSNPDQIVVARKDSPLVIGIGEDGNYIASDIPAILGYTRDVYFLEEKEVALITRDKVEIFNEDGQRVDKEIFKVNWDVSAAEKGGYQHFMLKEIHEEPQGLKATLNPRLTEDHRDIDLKELGLTPERVKELEKIYIVACGSAFHTALVGKQVIEQLARIPVETDIASEFRYRNPILNERDLVIVISQSGETADTIAALREAKKKGARVAAIVNVVGSTISREAHDVLYTWAGPEIAVATTKAYSTQLLSLYLIALDLAKKAGRIDAKQYAQIIEALNRIPQQVEVILKDKTNLQKYADSHFNARNIFFMGRGLDYAIAMEGSLKLKEISYIHSEAYAAGELKHGTIALIEEGTLVVAVATQGRLFEKTLNNIKEVKARGAVIMAVVMEGQEDIKEVADHVIYIPRTLEIVAPILTVVPLQLFAYYVAVEKGCDVDKPRNLAKSVTVE
ncbi:MAG: glutamine--fructose-6-phosphate transaminase (isomerizing) [Mahellales bacterium]|jgi:glucosamine--fructose-6-phosphate aminotransferase (isomerizing)